MKTIRIFFVATVISLLATSAFAQFPGRVGEEFSGIQKTDGNPSPTAGFSNNETNSRIDDYIYQNEQINIDPLTTGVVKVLRVNQKNLINDFVTKLVKVNNVEPREIRTTFRSVTSIEGGRAEIVRDKKTKDNWVQLIAPTFMMPALEKAVHDLDEKWVLNVRDGSETRSEGTKWRPADTVDQFASLYAGEGVTQVDGLAGIVTRRDEPYRVEEYFIGMAKHDIPPPQALFKFSIYEISASNDYLAGVDWIAWKNGPGRSLFELILGGNYAHNAFENATGNFDPNFGATTHYNDGDHARTLDVAQSAVSVNYVLTSAYLDFLRVKGKARVVATPEIFTLTHKTAVWSSVDQFVSFDVTPSNPDAFGIKPVKLNKANTGITGGETTDSDFAAHNRFLRHDVGPKNTLGLTITLFAAIGQESSEVQVDFQSTDLAGTTPQGTPIISSRRLVTKQRMVDGKPQILGSLMREEEIHGADKAPYLGDIPVVGYLLGRESQTRGHKEIVVMVTPLIYAGSKSGAPDMVQGETEIQTTKLAMPGEEPPAVPNNYEGFDNWIFEGVTPAVP